MKKRRRRGRNSWRAAFPNVAGIKGKNKEFWEEIRNWDVMY